MEGNGREEKEEVRMGKEREGKREWEKGKGKVRRGQRGWEMVKEERTERIREREIGNRKTREWG